MHTLASLVCVCRMLFESQYQSGLSRVESVLRTCRPITPEERKLLEANGNLFDSDSEFRLVGEVDLCRIRNNCFMGSVVIGGPLGGRVGVHMAGIFNSTLSNVVVDVGSVCIRDCVLVSSCFISSGCCLIGNGPIGAAVGDGKFGIGSPLTLCDETGSRQIFLRPNVLMEEIDSAVSTKRGQNEWNNLHAGSNNAFVESPYMQSWFGHNTSIIGCGSVGSVWALEGDLSVNNSQVSECVVSRMVEINNSIVAKSMISNNVHVGGYAIVENSVLLPYSHVGVHGKVIHSVIGSYSHVESGECISSLIGPFVGCHHQSLCIATYWPAGRGNIGYGANVGSNHTGKAPDQELLSGEGLFYGLAAIVKFPSNFLKAPYSLIASGVTCLPQCVEFPFSLINSSGATSGLNEIFPGWVLSDNMFTLLRNESKFKSRQKSDAPVEWQVFRPEIMKLVVDARDRLVTAGGNKKNSYTESDIFGLGKNFLTESSRLKAIDTYTFIIRWYSLRGLYRKLQTGVAGTDWTFEKKLLTAEHYNLTQTESLLNEFANLDQSLSNNCVLSKAKDDIRGKKIIGATYTEFHAPAHTHPVCVAALTESKKIYESVALIMAKL